MNQKSKKTAKRDGAKKKAGKRGGEKASGMASERPRGLRAVKVNDMSLEEWWPKRDEFIKEAERRAGPAKVAADNTTGAETSATIEAPKQNRRFKGPSGKTIDLILEGGARIPSYDHRTVDHLARLVIDLQIFFGQQRQDAAHFLFSVWMDSYGATPDLNEGLKQFGRDVVAANEPKKRRGRPRKPLVTKLKELQEQGYTIRQGCEMAIPDWHGMLKDTQDMLVRGYTEAVGKRTRRDRASQEAESDPDKL